jgi:hypothetical protein
VFNVVPRAERLVYVVPVERVWRCILLVSEYRIPRAKLDECEFSFVESADTVSGV